MKDSMLNIPEMRDTGSSFIKQVGYDPMTKRMFSKFASGQTYVYDDVEQEEFDSLLNAESIGKHFQSTIRKNKVSNLFSNKE